MPCRKVRVTNELNILEDLNIPSQFAGLESYVIDFDIAIDSDENKIYIAYLLLDGEGYYFSPDSITLLK